MWALSGDYQLVESLGENLAGTVGTVINSTTFVEIAASTSADADGFMLYAQYRATNAKINVSVGIGGSGVEETIAEKLLLVTRGTSWRNGFCYWIPVAIPGGSRVSLKMVDDGGGAENSRGYIVTYKSGFSASPPFSSCDFIGTVEVDPGGTANTKSSFTNGQIIASTAHDYQSIIFATHATAIATSVHSYVLYDIGIGSSGSEEILVENMFVYKGDAQETYQPYANPVMPFKIPAGSRLAFRAQSTHNTVDEREINISMWGFR